MHCVVDYPYHWEIDDITKLLKGCGPEICKELFGNRVINGRLSDAYIWAYHLALVCVSSLDEATTGWLIDILLHVKALLPANDKRKFAAMFMDNWRDYLICLVMMGFTDEVISGIISLTEFFAVYMAHFGSLTSLDKAQVLMLRLPL